MDEEIVMVLHLRTRSDKNGKPRELFLGLDANGRVMKVYNGNYIDYPLWVSNWMRSAVGRGRRWPMPIEVTPSTYKGFKKMLKEEK